MIVSEPKDDSDMLLMKWNGCTKFISENCICHISDWPSAASWCSKLIKQHSSPAMTVSVCNSKLQENLLLLRLASGNNIQNVTFTGQECEELVGLWIY